MPGGGHNSQDQIAQAQAAVNADPHIQELLRRYRLAPSTHLASQLIDAAEKLSPGLRIDRTGKVTNASGWGGAVAKTVGLPLLGVATAGTINHFLPGAAAASGSGVLHGGADVGHNALSSLVAGGTHGAAATGTSGLAGGAMAGATHAIAPTGAAVGGSSVPWWLRPAIAATAPVISRLASGGGSPNGGNGSGVPGVSDELNNDLRDLMAMGKQRIQSTQPVHDAAMKLAMSLAPNGQSVPLPSNPGHQTAPMDPQVLQAIAALMGRR